MKFKIFFDDSIGALNINCLNSNCVNTILPKNLTEHVQYEIPNEFNELIKEDLLDMLNPELNPELNDELNDEFKKINTQIEKLIKQKTELLKQIRADNNPKIIEMCKLFKEKYAEFFV